MSSEFSVEEEMSEPFKFPAIGQFVYAGEIRVLVIGYGGDDGADTSVSIIMDLLENKLDYQSGGLVPIPDKDLTREENQLRSNWAGAINK